MVQRTTPRPRALRSRATVRIAALCAVVLTLGVVGGSAQGDVANQDELPTYPESGKWVAVRATSINYAAAAKQWIRLPPLFVSAYNRRSTNLIDRRCLEGVGVLYPYQDRVTRDATMHFRSSANAPAAYGYVGPFTVRTVAFGSIPVEARVQLRQLRTGDNKSVGIDIKAPEQNFCPDRGPLPAEKTLHVSSADVKGKLEVAVTGLEVDGVDLKLRKTCRTRQPAALTLSSTEYFATVESDGILLKEFYTKNGAEMHRLEPQEEPKEANLFTTPVFNLVYGGLLTGNVTIPAFAACLTEGGEDISKLLTTTVAGNDNPVIVRAEGLDSLPSETPLPDLPFPTAAP